MNAEVRIEAANFETVLPVWGTELWPGRRSGIEPVSAVAENGGIEMNLMNNKVDFFVARLGNRVIGTIAGQTNSTESLRSRGIWVAPDFRGQGLGKALMAKLEKMARGENLKYIWSMPRLESAEFYRKQGFREYARTDAYEFGPHLLMRKDVGG